MAILVVIMMIATAFVPVATMIEDSTSSDAATSTTSGVKDISVSIITAESGDKVLANVAYLGEELPDNSTVDPTSWVRDDPENGGTGFWYNINKEDTSNYGKVLTYGSLMYPAQIKEDIAAYFKDTGGNPLFNTSNYQFIQITYTVDYACNVNVTISKDSIVLKSSNSYETDYAAGCYVEDKRQCVLYSIATGGDLEPSNPRGTYDFVIKCEQKDIVYSGSKEFSASDVKLYGTVYDNNAAIDGQTANVIMGATINYEILDTSGQTIGTGNTTMIKDTTSEKYGKFYVSVAMGNMVKITSVVADGYSFTNHTFTSNPVMSDTDDVDETIAPGQQRSSPIFTADQFSSVIHVTDTAGLGLENITVKAAWYYRVIGDGTSTFYRDEAEKKISGLTAGTVGFVSDVTDSDGNITLTYTSPVKPLDVEDKLYVYAENTAAYTFDTSGFLTDEQLEQPLPMTSFPNIEEGGHAYLDVSKTLLSLSAEESSFTASFNGTEDDDGYGGAPLEGVTVNATWLYDYLDSATGNRTITDDPNGKGLDVSVVGLASPTTTKTDSDGHITIAYRLPVLGEKGKETINCYLYISSTSDVFKLSSKPVSELIGTSKSTLPELVAGMASCIAIPLSDFSGSLGVAPELTTDEQITYNVGWKVVPTDENHVPDSVSVVYYGEGWKESRSFTAYREYGEKYIEFNTVVINRDAMHIDISATGYTLTYQSWIGSITSGTQKFTATASVSTDPVVATREPGHLSGETYTVHGLSDGDSVTFTYMVGSDKYTVIVPAVNDGSEYKATHSISGWPGLQSVDDVQATTSADVYLGSFVNNEVTAVKLVDKSFVAYSDSGSEPVPTIKNLLTNKNIQVYYNGDLYTQFTFGDTGTSVVSVPESGNVMYIYDSKQIIPEEQTSGVFIGYHAFNFYGYINEEAVKTTMTVEIKYVASSSLENVSAATTKVIVNPDSDMPIYSIMTYGDTKSFVAPEISGFSFSGWVYNGSLINSGSNTYNFTADKTMGDSATLYAVYGAETVTQEPDNSMDKTIIAIGVITVVVALLIFVYVIFQSRRF